MYRYKRFLKQLSLFSIVMVIGICFTGCGIIKNLLPNNSSSHMGGINITCAISENNDSWTQDDLEDTRKKLEKRAQQYSTMASVLIEGDERIIIDIPGEYDEEIINSLLSNSKLYFCTATDYTPTDEDLSNGKYIEITDHPGYEGFYQVWVTSEQIADASAEVMTDDTENAEYVVSLNLTDEGSDAFFNMTSAYVGQQTYIIYDGSIISAPTVMTAISGGQVQIDGMESLEEAEALASNIRIGSLDLNLEVIDYKVTEPR